MKEHLKRVLRLACIAAFWVFIFSIRWDGRTLFSYLNEILVQNRIVRAVDESLADLWYKVSETASTTFHKLSDTEKRKG